MRMRLSFLFALFLLAAAAGPAASANGGVALLIGNAAYPNADAPLKEPVSDARALGAQLRDQGFDVDIGENLSKQAMQAALDRFYGKVKPTSPVMIFFSGFGIQTGRQSYLIPVDAQIWNEGDVRRDGFSLDKILNDMANKGAQIKIAIIDASRHNPYERNFRSVPAGLAAVTAPEGAAVMMSAPSAAVVSDGGTAVFVSELIKELKVPGATVEQVLNRTRVDVSRDTKGQQVPSVSSSLQEDFSFDSGPQSNPSPQPKVTEAPPVDKPAAPASTPSSSAPKPSPQPKVTEAPPVNKPPAPASTPSSSESDPEAKARHDYVAAESTGTKQAWDDFLAKHPSGYYSDLARQQVAKLVPDTATKPSPSDDATPTDLAGYYRRGQRYAVSGDYDKAIKDFTEVIRLNPKHAGALNDRCWVRAIIGDLGNALKDCSEALRVAPNYVDALDSRGLVNLKTGMLHQAIADYDAALQGDPKHAASLYGRGIAKMRNGDVDGGKKDIDAAKAIQATIADEFAGYGIR
jgi:Caspase domain/Tetratricopeptide repeat